MFYKAMREFLRSVGLFSLVIFCAVLAFVALIVCCVVVDELLCRYDGALLWRNALTIIAIVVLGIFIVALLLSAAGRFLDFLIDH